MMKIIMLSERPDAKSPVGADMITDEWQGGQLEVHLHRYADLAGGRWTVKNTVAVNGKR